MIKQNKYPFVVYWLNKEKIRKWKCSSTLDKALRFKKALLNSGGVMQVWVAKDIDENTDQ